MVALVVLGFFFSFALILWISSKAADFHYKYYKGDAPLYLYYYFVFVAFYTAMLLQIFSNYK